MAFLAVCFIAIWLIAHPVNRVRYAGYPILLVALVICKMAALGPIKTMIQLNPPPVSRYQANHFFNASNQNRKIKHIIITAGKDRKNIESFFTRLGITAVPVNEVASHATAEDQVWFTAIKESNYYINSLKKARQVNALMLRENNTFINVENILNRMGYRTEPMAGGVLGIQDRKQVELRNTKIRRHFKQSATSKSNHSHSLITH